MYPFLVKLPESFCFQCAFCKQFVIQVIQCSCRTYNTYIFPDLKAITWLSAGFSTAWAQVPTRQLPGIEILSKVPTYIYSSSRVCKIQLLVELLKTETVYTLAPCLACDKPRGSYPYITIIPCSDLTQRSLRRPGIRLPHCRFLRV